MEKSRVEAVEVWVGLDVGKQDHHATALSQSGERLFERGVRNDERAIEQLIDRAAEHGQAALVIDQPGSIGALVLALARRRGVPVAYVPGLVMRRASELYPGEAKTDRRDSFVLADTARTHAHRLHWLEASDELIEQLGLLSGYDDDLAGDWTRTVNRLRDLLLSLAPALERVLGGRLEHPAARALLARYPTPTALRGARRGHLVRLAKRHAPRMGERLVDEIVQALAARTVTVPAERTAGRVIAELAEELDRLAGRRDQLEREIEALFLSHPQAPVLLSIPGIGVKTGARILTEIGDIDRFPTAAQLASHAGLAPVTRQSGSSIRSEQKSRRGNQRLKNALWLSAFCSLRNERSAA